MIVVFHYCLYLILVKGVKYLPFQLICEKIFVKNLVTFNKPLIDSF